MSPTAAGNSKIAQIIRRHTGANADAARWFLSVLDLSNLWDHIVDGDEIDRAEADATLFEVAVGWGLNEFYRRNSAILSTVALNCVTAWRSSRNPGLRAKAFDVATELGTTVVFLVSGPAVAQVASVELREWALNKQVENDRKGRDGSLAS